MSTQLRTTVRLMLVVFGAAAIAIAVLAGLRPIVPREVLVASNPEVGNYLQAVGTIYAVLLAFVVYVVWGQFNDARTQVDHEANEVIDLYRTADGFPEGPRRAVQQRLDRYVADVLGLEWRAMASGDEPVFERTSAHLDAVWDGLHCFEASNQCEGALHAEALSRFNDLSDARTSRLTSARMRIPLGLRLLLYVGGFVLIASMYLLAVERFAIHAIITGAMAGAVAHVLYLVLDLDDAFAGEWRVSPAAFERVQRHMARRSAAAGADRCAVDLKS